MRSESIAMKQFPVINFGVTHTTRCFETLTDVGTDLTMNLHESVHDFKELEQSIL